MAVGLALALPVACLRARAPGRRIVRWWLQRAGAALGLRVVVHGGPAPTPVLWCANHVSWLDVLALGALAEVAFVAKSEVRAWPLVGWLAAAAGTLFLARGSGAAAMEKMTERLRAGRCIALFPEGTTSSGERVGTFHSRMFAAALDAGAKVQPVALRFSEAGRRSRTAPFVGDEAFLPHLLRVLAAAPLRVDVAFGAPFPAAEADRRELARAVERAVAAMLVELPGDAPPVAGHGTPPLAPPHRPRGAPGRAPLDMARGGAR